MIELDGSMHILLIETSISNATNYPLYMDIELFSYCHLVPIFLELAKIYFKRISAIIFMKQL